MSADEDSLLGLDRGVGGAGGATASSACYGRNMTFPRHGPGAGGGGAYGHPRHHELPAIVTEGENYRLSAEVIGAHFLESRMRSANDRVTIECQSAWA